MVIVCRHCNCEEMQERTSGVHIGLYCRNCGRWQKWIRLSAEGKSRKATQTQQDYAVHLFERWMESNSPMTAEQAGSIIKNFKSLEDTK